MKHLFASVVLLASLLGPALAEPDVPTDPPADSGRADSDRYSAGRVRLGGEQGFGLGSATPDPTALEGPTRLGTVLLNSMTYSNISISAHYLGPSFLFEVQGGLDNLGGDASYSFNENVTVNLFGETGRIPAFEGGPFRVRLANGESPYFRRWGGGVEYADRSSEEFSYAAALNFQTYDVGRNPFGPVVQPPVDQLGNPLTFSPTGTDELLTLNFVGQYNDLDQLQNPTVGTRVRFNLGQAVPVGDSQITSTVGAVNLAHLIPAPGPGEGASYVLLNFQGGFQTGDVAPYRAFQLGGANSNRGYALGELGASASFLQGTVEYRGSLTNFEVFGTEFDMKGVLFVDYATDLGTSNDVFGTPGPVRRKDGDGLGYGAGLYFFGDVGLLRLDLGFNESGNTQFFFTLGDRF